jgi:hypothetical protein
MRKWFLFLVCATALVSCEKDIELHPDLQEPKLVVDAQIESTQSPFVILSHSLDYFSTIDAATLNNTYVHNAKVTISVGTKVYPLTEVAVLLPSGYYFYYYGVSVSTSTPLFGEYGKKYDLQIETGGKTYNASTNIPLLTKKVDSLWWKKAPNNSDTTKVVLMARITDPPGYGNYIRYFTKANREDYLPGRNSVYDDQIIDGVTYDIQVDKGYNKNEKPTRDDAGYFKRGDTVTVRHSNIDKATYDFWRTWEFSYQSIGNPFSTPGIVLGNISNGGLGSFCGYASQYRTLIIPK